MARAKRVILYAPDEQYKRLRIKLLKEHKSVSFWFREKVTEFLKEGGAK